MAKVGFLLGDTQASLALAAAEAQLAAWISPVQRLRINNREQWMAGRDEIIKTIDYWRWRVGREQQLAEIAAGMGDRRKVHVRLGRG